MPPGGPAVEALACHRIRPAGREPLQVARLGGLHLDAGHELLGQVVRAQVARWPKRPVRIARGDGVPLAGSGRAPHQQVGPARPKGRSSAARGPGCQPGPTASTPLPPLPSIPAQALACPALRQEGAAMVSTHPASQPALRARSPAPWRQKDPGDGPWDLAQVDSVLGQQLQLALGRRLPGGWVHDRQGHKALESGPQHAPPVESAALHNRHSVREGFGRVCYLAAGDTRRKREASYCPAHGFPAGSPIGGLALPATLELAPQAYQQGKPAPIAGPCACLHGDDGLPAPIDQNEVGVVGGAAKWVGVGLPLLVAAQRVLGVGQPGVRLCSRRG